MPPTFTIGIEEEYQTVDPSTGELRSHIQAELLQKGKLLLQERVKAEMHQSVIEVGTGICNNIKDAKAEVKMLRRDIVRLAKENGLRLARWRRIRFRTGGGRRFIRTTAISTLSKTCSWWRERI